MKTQAVENELRQMMRELQLSGDLSPQLDVRTMNLGLSLEDAGFDSVARVTLAALIDERFAVLIDDEDFSEHTKLRDIVSYLATKTV